jgi:hypothetical protein
MVVSLIFKTLLTKKKDLGNGKKALQDISGCHVMKLRMLQNDTVFMSMQRSYSNIVTR